MRFILKTEHGYYKRINGKPEWVERRENAQRFDSERKVHDLIGFLGGNVWHPEIQVVDDCPAEGNA